MVKTCGVRLTAMRLVELKIDGESFSFTVQGAHLFAGQIKQVCRQGSGLTNRRRKTTLKEKKVFGRI